MQKIVKERRLHRPALFLLSMAMLQLIVYDAIYGVCNGGLYWAMNRGCNEFYSATDTRLNSTLPGSPGWRCTPPPWAARQ